VLALVGDSSSGVRQKAIEVCKTFTLEPSEIRELENLLVRKAGDLRRALLTLLSHQDVPQALESAVRLTGSRKTELRQAGLEVLLELKKRKILPPEGRELARSLTLSSAGELLLREQVLSEAEEATLEDGLGLFDPQKLAPLPAIQARALPTGSITVALLTALDELIHLHRETPLRVQQHWDGGQDVLLGNLGHFPDTYHIVPPAPKPPIPLSEVWLEWWNTRSSELRFDEHDARRALLSWNLGHPLLESKDEKIFENMSESVLGDEAGDVNTLVEQLGDAAQLVLEAMGLPVPESNLAQPPRIVPTGLEDIQIPQLKYGGLVMGVLQYLQRQTASTADLEYTLDLLENHLERMDLAYMPAKPPPERPWDHPRDPREILSIYSFGGPSELWTTELLERSWNLSNYVDRAFVNLGRRRGQFGLTVKMGLESLGSEHDILDHLIGPRPEGHSFHELKEFSGRKKIPILEQYPFLEVLVERCRTRILQLELARGSLPTAASSLVSRLRSVYGAEKMLRLLQALGNETLVRGYTSGNLSKTSTFSHLMRVSFPAPEDTPQSFKTLALSLNIAPNRLLELAMFAPQWSAFIEHALGFRSLEDGVYWLHAHTKDQNWSVDREILELWEAEIAERTPLSPADLLEGAVDVGWFGKLYKSLGAGNWAALCKAAKYASSSGGHKRAELYASALLGQLEEEALLESIKTKRHQDSVRALGLLPLPKAPKKRQAQSLSRYKGIQAFLKGSKEFGAQKQASEGLAGRIGLQNLARSAGYSDPERLMWSLESAWTQSLLMGPGTLELEGVTLTLKLTELGETELLIVKGGKKLKSVPSSIVKLPEVKALLESKKDLSSQKGRMRALLEQAMCEGHLFAAFELPDLWAHPILKPLLEKLVWVDDKDVTGRIDPDLEGLIRTSGERMALKDSSLRIAHPTDLYRSGDWRAWQAFCVESQLEQLFKQVFRELYIPTAAEKDALRSKRYAGHSVNPRQALALLKSRQWVTVPEEGVRKTLHSEGISVWLNFEEGFYTPTELEGLTLEGVYFTEKGKYKALELGSMNPRAFSEVMRDLDLVVSVAHLGGVDPEASASTVEMRQNLLRETLRLLKIENVRLEGQHALIKGHLGDYTLHLGSAGVHRQPGGSLCILPVHAQHGGRIFLPFADNDPRTAEVISKVLLLAKDREIKDPTILEQLI